MEYCYVGSDVSVKTPAFRIVDGAGAVVGETAVAAEPAAAAAFPGGTGLRIVRKAGAVHT